LFRKGQLRFVFSYVTSLAYHWGIDKDRSYKALSFEAGHPLQVELAAIPADCRECELARDLLRTLHAPWAQTLIMQKNFMFPVVKGLTEGTVFAQLPVLKTIGDAEADSNLDEWDQIFSH
jgi:thiamine transport system substrate-binding protein